MKKIIFDNGIFNLSLGYIVMNREGVMDVLKQTEVIWIDGHKFYLPEEIRSRFATDKFAVMDLTDFDLLNECDDLNKYEYFFIRSKEYYENKLSEMHDKASDDPYVYKMFKKIEESMIDINMDDDGIVEIPRWYIDELKTRGKVFGDTLAVSYSFGSVELVHPLYYENHPDKDKTVEELVNKIMDMV